MSSVRHKELTRPPPVSTTGWETAAWETAAVTAAPMQSSPPPPSPGSSKSGRKYNIPYKGVFKVGRGPLWQAQISVDGTTKHLGVFATMEDAARAYDARALELGRDTNFDYTTTAATTPSTMDQAHVQAFWSGVRQVTDHLGAAARRESSAGDR